MIMWLVGMMGTGKTSVGRQVASDLGVDFVDVDRFIEEKHARSISEIWRESGEIEFRRLESAAISEIANAGSGSDQDSIIATGGGAVLSGGNVRAMKSVGILIWLDASVATLAGRLGGSRDRPLLGGVSDPDLVLSTLAEEREETYKTVADHRVEVDDRVASEVAEVVKGIWTTL